ncbi:MAG TPA: stage II sporulation protein M, partial [Acidobacteriota bacterium]|nr:stage II sporulation protein M [Acidobacteriota bacterium]
LAFIGSMLFHTILEFSGYIFAGMAGSLLAIAVIKHPWKSPSMKRVFKYTLQVYIVGLVCIVAGAVLESLQR